MLGLMIEFPPYEPVGDFEDDLELLVESLRRIHQNMDTSSNGSFELNGSYQDGKFRRFLLDFVISKPEAKCTEEQTAPRLTPILDTVAAFELAVQPLKQSEKKLRLLPDVRHHPAQPETPIFSWHDGDPLRYMASLGLCTAFIVGEVEIPKDYQGSHFNNPQILKHILAHNDNKLPAGLELVRPKPGELVRIDRRHVHCIPPNPTKTAIKRTIMKVDTLFYYESMAA